MKSTVLTDIMRIIIIHNFNRYNYHTEMFEWEIDKLDTIQLDDGNNYQIANDYTINTIGSICGVFEFIFDWPSDGTQWYLETYYRNGMQVYDRKKNYLSQKKVNKKNNCVYVDENSQVFFDLRNDVSPDLETILIYSLTGKQTLSVHPHASEIITIQNLQRGIYLYRLVYSDTNEYNCGKFTVK